MILIKEIEVVNKEQNRKVVVKGLIWVTTKPRLEKFREKQKQKYSKSKGSRILFTFITL